MGEEREAEARRLHLEIVKLRLRLLGQPAVERADEEGLLSEIERLRDRLRAIHPTPLPPAERAAVERRRHPRYPLRLPVRYQIVSAPGVESLTVEELSQLPEPADESWSRARSARTTNVSAGGVAFLIPGTLSRGSLLWIELDLPPAAGRLRAVASIARALPGGAGTLVGAEFFGLTDAAAALLDATLHGMT